MGWGVQCAEPQKAERSHKEDTSWPLGLLSCMSLPTGMRAGWSSVCQAVTANSPASGLPSKKSLKILRLPSQEASQPAL